MIRPTNTQHLLAPPRKDYPSLG